jgi:hypothetical protein
MQIIFLNRLGRISFSGKTVLHRDNRAVYELTSKNMVLPTDSMVAHLMLDK